MVVRGTATRSLVFALLVGGTAACGRSCETKKPAPVAPPARLVRDEASPGRVLDESIVFHRVRLDTRGMLLPAFDVEAPFAHVTRLAWDAFSTMPNAPDGRKPYFTTSMFEPKPDNAFAPVAWLANPAGLAAMLVRSSLRWYAWSGDRRAIDATRAFVDHVLAHGLTSETDDWARVPYASANAGESEYRGADDTAHCDGHLPCGKGDGRGILEPDKVGELGYSLFLLHRFTGDARYREAAVRFADVLAAHIQTGDAEHSPWPFRVDAATGHVVREPYSSNVIFTIALFDALEMHHDARAKALAWLVKYPLTTMHWQGYFEDIAIHDKPGSNPNQYSAGETARWLFDHPGAVPDATVRARATVAWIEKEFAIDVEKTPGHWYGAEVISEQRADMAKMSSHTARYASLLARLYETTGEPELRARAMRSFAWATYCVNDRGSVKVGPDDREGYWFTDGYGDFMIHLLDGMASVPAWAPLHEAHVLRTNDVLVDVVYEPTRMRYRGTGAGMEEIRVPALPKSVDGGVSTIASSPDGGALVTVRRERAGAVVIAW